MGGNDFGLAIAGAGVGADVCAHVIHGVEHGAVVSEVEGRALPVMLLHSDGGHAISFVGGFGGETEQEAHLVEVFASTIFGNGAFAVHDAGARIKDGGDRSVNGGRFKFRASRN